MHSPGQVARHLARVVEGDIGVVGQMHRLSPHVVAESAEAILALVAVTVTVSGSETAMEDGLGMRGIGVRRILGENHCLREHHGVTGIGDQGNDGRCLGLVLVLVRHHREDGGRCVCVELILNLIKLLFENSFSPRMRRPVMSKKFEHASADETRGSSLSGFRWFLGHRRPLICHLWATFPLEMISIQYPRVLCLQSILDIPNSRDPPRGIHSNGAS